MNIEQARFNMIEQQIRPYEVLEQRVLNLMTEIPREDFVPVVYRQLAFADINIPLAHDQVMMSPKLEGRLLQSLMLTPQDTVLEIGTGSGYLTALLSKLVTHVDSVDIFADVIATAQEKLDALNINNVSLHVADAIKGWNTDIKYDVIVLTGSVPLLESQFDQQLKKGGCLFAIVGNAPIMQAQLINRIDSNNLNTEVLFETSIPPLIGASNPNHFIF